MAPTPSSLELATGGLQSVSMPANRVAETTPDHTPQAWEARWVTLIPATIGCGMNQHHLPVNFGLVPSSLCSTSSKVAPH